MKDKIFDVVIYGATGFTGKLVVEYMQNNYGNDNNIAWAMAGRNHNKLCEVRDELGVSKDVPLLVADSSDIQSISAMVKQTKCILTTVGPYQLYGSDVVSECANNGTDYVDLCGEPGWMHEQINQHSEAAKNSGARIVFSCGFDSIPFDLGVLFLQNEVISRLGKAVQNINSDCLFNYTTISWFILWNCYIILFFF